MRGDGSVLPVAARSAPPTSIRHGFLFFVAVFGVKALRLSPDYAGDKWSAFGAQHSWDTAHRAGLHLMQTNNYL